MLIPLVYSLLCPCASLANYFEQPLIQFFGPLLSLIVFIQYFSSSGIKECIDLRIGLMDV